VEQARRTIIKSFMGFGANSITANSSNCGMRTSASTWKTSTGFRSNAKHRGSTHATDWSRYPSQLQIFSERLQEVVIENKGALEVIAQYDDPDCLFYIDPPYPLSTRTAHCKCYRNELTDQDHINLSNVLHSVSGMVIISGYDCELYRDLYAGWRMETRAAFADGAKKRIECLWISPNTVTPQGRLL
jgi:DNA adenine methylase